MRHGIWKDVKDVKGPGDINITRVRFKQPLLRIYNIHFNVK
jgi:hypothetical protein